MKLRRATSLIFFLSFLAFSHASLAAPQQDMLRGALDINAIMASPQFSTSIQLILALALISLVPFFLISVTSFIRILVVLVLAKTAVGTQQVPPNAILIGLALFMTVFIMSPVWQEVNGVAITPYNQGKITQARAFELGIKPIQKFMLKQTRERDLALFVQFSKIKPPKSFDKIPVYVVIPAFMISELKTAFQIGFLLFVPFVIIDLVVANILLSLGMFMLSPVMVSLPFKVLLFVLADGWQLITRGLLISFR